MPLITERSQDGLSLKSWRGSGTTRGVVQECGGAIKKGDKSFLENYEPISHLSQMIQDTEKHNQPLCMAFVDYEEAFESTENWTILDALQRCHIDSRYIEVLRYMYKAASMTVYI
ncbi:uncharacterized protein LOC123664376 [Melitaea cinxia]|uniref:uncharacterized protein LOC123664376 n=1 Tax=Melitaea cinxia TaxID=113334 RepID=UPI001E273A0D|nr:uncharacterized protein LOC123664376 [Melitaea cinxia]